MGSNIYNTIIYTSSRPAQAYIHESRIAPMIMLPSSCFCLIQWQRLIPIDYLRIDRRDLCRHLDRTSARIGLASGSTDLLSTMSSLFGQHPRLLTDDLPLGICPEPYRHANNVKSSGFGALVYQSTQKRRDRVQAEQPKFEGLVEAAAGDEGGWKGVVEAQHGECGYEAERL